MILIIFGEKMKFLKTVLVLLLLNSISAFSQDDELDDWTFDSEPLKEDKVPYFAIAGGYTGTFFMANTNELNSILQNVYSFDSDAISSPIYMNGFEIFTGLPFLTNFRAGFYSRTGSTLQEKNISDNTVRYAEYAISNSGINFEYAFVPFKKFAITFGTGIGWGNIELDIYQSQNSIDWNNIAAEQPANNFFHRAEAGFLSVEPKLNIEYAVQSWLALKLGANYTLSIMETGIFSDAKWQYNQSSSINNFPNEINASGIGINFGIMIGLFNY